MDYLIISPASYTKPSPRTWEEVMSNWTNGKDFKIHNGPYCSIRDLKLLKDLCHHLVVKYRDSQGNLITGYISLCGKEPQKG